MIYNPENMTFATEVHAFGSLAMLPQTRVRVSGYGSSMMFGYYYEASRLESFGEIYDPNYGWGVMLPEHLDKLVTPAEAWS